MGDKERSFIALDGLRGVAALAIVIRHGSIYFGNLLFESYLAVDFFFVLSCFVLYHAYGQRITTGRLSANEFMLLRIIRLYPLYLLGTAIAVVTIIAHNHRVYSSADSSLLQVLSAIFFVPYLSSSDGFIFPLNDPAWSLFFELVANVAFVIIIVRLGKMGVLFVAGLSALIMLWAVLHRQIGFGFNHDTGVMDSGFNSGSIVAGIVRVGYSFFCGVILYELWSRTHCRVKINPMLIGVALFTLLAFHPSANYQTAYDIVATIFILPLLIRLGASSVTDGSVKRGFELLGATSYGVYILQSPIYALMTLLLGKLLPGRYATAYFGAAIVCMIFIFTIMAYTFTSCPCESC